MFEIIANLLETARLRFIEKNPVMSESSNRKMAETWMKHSSEDPVKNAVEYAASVHRMDSEEISREVYASLKFRVLAGIVTSPISYEELSGGVCANQQWDEETGSWGCKVSSNQSQANNWHEVFGNTPACPFWKNPNPGVTTNTELSKLLEEEGKTLEEAYQELGMKIRKGN